MNYILHVNHSIKKIELPNFPSFWPKSDLGLVSVVFIVSVKELYPAIITNLLEGPNFQVCESCGDQLKGGANSLRRHQCVCRTGDVSLRCPVCSKVLKSRSFKAHMQYHKSQEQNRELLVCVYCDNKPFTSAISLKRHMLIHENARPFQCKDCDKSFRQKSGLTVHERVHSGIRYSCMCGKLFITKSLLNRHQKIASVRSSCHGPSAESRV